MDAVDKALKRLSKIEQAWVGDVIRKVMAGKLHGLDIKKLKGYEDIFRIRKGDVRVIYRKKGGHFSLLFVGRKSEKTYVF